MPSYRICSSGSAYTICQIDILYTEVDIICVGCLKQLFCPIIPLDRKWITCYIRQNNCEMSATSIYMGKPLFEVGTGLACDMWFELWSNYLGGGGGGGGRGGEMMLK